MPDPYCLEFIEAMATILVHLQQRENLHAQESRPTLEPSVLYRRP